MIHSEPLRKDSKDSKDSEAAHLSQSSQESFKAVSPETKMGI